MTKPKPRPITLPATYWLETVLPVISSAIPHQPDAMLTRFAAAIRERCKAGGDATLNSPAERWAEIWHRVCAEMWRNRELQVTFADLDRLRDAINEIVYGKRRTAAERPLSADERRHAKDVAARMDADPEWPGFELEHAREAEPEPAPVKERTLF